MDANAMRPLATRWGVWGPGPVTPVPPAGPRGGRRPAGPAPRRLPRALRIARTFLAAGSGSWAGYVLPVLLAGASGEATVPGGRAAAARAATR